MAPKYDAMPTPTDPRSSPNAVTIKESNSNITSQSPASISQILQLMRINEAPFIVGYLIHAIGALHAGIVLKTPPLHITGICLYLALLNSVLSCANSTWNDIWSREHDAKVARCQLQSLAQDAISVTSARLLCAALTLFYLVLLLPLPRPCVIYASVMMLAMACYPLSKHWFNCHELILAVVMPCSVFIGAAAAGQTPLRYPPTLSPRDILDISTWTAADSAGAASLLCTYAMFACWVVVLELVHSLQHAKNDSEAGVGATKSVFSNTASAKFFLYAVVMLHSTLFLCVGILLGADLRFWSAVSLTVSCSLLHQLSGLDRRDPESCCYWFSKESRRTGALLMLGFAIEYVRRVDGLDFRVGDVLRQDLTSLVSR